MWWKIFIVFCRKFIQKIMYQILSESAKFCGRCHKDILAYFFPGHSLDRMRLSMHVFLGHGLDRTRLSMHVFLGHGLDRTRLSMHVFLGHGLDRTRLSMHVSAG